jgi:hypothetical protein
MARLNVDRVTATVDIQTVSSGDSVFVTANGAKVLEFTKSGHLRRLKNTPAVGLRRLDDGTGRIAIMPRQGR